jgi:hypothetical protein
MKIKVHRTVILNILYVGVKIGLSHMQRVFENRMLRKISVPKKGR